MGLLAFIFCAIFISLGSLAAQNAQWASAFTYALGFMWMATMAISSAVKGAK